LTKLNLCAFFSRKQIVDFKGINSYPMGIYDFLLTVLGRRCTMTPLDNINGSTAQPIDTYPNR
jgi:hypothetical protein